MRKVIIPVVLFAGFSAFAMMPVAHADVITSTVREAGPTVGTDAVLLFALGSGIDAFMTNFVITEQDNTSAGLQIGSYSVTSGPLSLKGIYSDPTGAQGSYATSSGPAAVQDANGVGIAYSWIGNGLWNSAGFTDSLHVPAASVVANESSVAYGPYATAGDDPYSGPLAAFHVEGGWSTSIDATATGGVGNGDGALLAVAIVPHNDSVSFFGTIDQLPGNPGTFSITDSVSAVPEPASLGIVAIGGAALLTRRRKA